MFACVRLCVYVSRYLEVCNVRQRGPIRYANWIPTVAYLSEFWIGSDWPSSLLPHYLIYLPSPPSLPRSHFLSSFSFNPSFLPSPSSPHGAYSISSLPPDAPGVPQEQQVLEPPGSDLQSRATQGPRSWPSHAQLGSWIVVCVQSPPTGHTARNHNTVRCW